MNGKTKETDYEQKFVYNDGTKSAFVTMPYTQYRAAGFHTRKREKEEENMTYKDICKSTAVEVAQQFNRKTYNNKPVFGRYKKNKYNTEIYVLLKPTYSPDDCIIVNVNGLPWDGLWENFYTTDKPPQYVIDLYNEGFFKSKCN